MTDPDLQQLERQNAIIEVARELGISIRGNMGKCFQMETHLNPKEDYTLFFNPSKNTFFCKACQDIGGSPMDLVCQVKKCDRKEAADWLAHRIEFDQKTQQMFGGRGRKKR